MTRGQFPQDMPKQKTKQSRCFACVLFTFVPTIKLPREERTADACGTQKQGLALYRLSRDQSKFLYLCFKLAGCAANLCKQCFAFAHELHSLLKKHSPHTVCGTGYELAPRIASLRYKSSIQTVANIWQDSFKVHKKKNLEDRQSFICFYFFFN